MYTKCEVYNYKIHNYSKLDVSTPFGDLQQKKNNFESNKISTFGSNAQNDTTVDGKMVLSYDPLNSLTTRNKYYKIYKTQNAKNSRYPLSEIDRDEYENLLDKVNINMDQKLSPFVPVPDIKRLLADANDDDGYIKKINITNVDKIVIFGDHHGSFHTFFRNMLRLHIFGVLNLMTYEINEPYRLIFLGDIVDRGQHSLDILEILFRFILNDNNDRIIINRGNHETNTMAKAFGFYNEITDAYEKTDRIENIFNKTMNFFKKCSSAIIIKNTESGHNFWLCHGFIPLKNGIIDIIKDFIDSANYIYIPPINFKIMKQIRWNDPKFYIIGQKYKKDYLFVNEYSSRSGNSMEMYDVGILYINEFLKKTNIKFIIRGHNDLYANATLLCNRLIVPSNNQNKLNISSFYELGSNNKYNKNNLDDKITRQKNIMNAFPNQYNNGSVENVIIQDHNWDIPDNINTINKNDLYVFPVLTISTNTDINRPLTCDSFIVLHTTDKDHSLSLFTINEDNHLINDYLSLNDDLLVATDTDILPKNQQNSPLTNDTGIFDSFKPKTTSITGPEVVKIVKDEPIRNNPKLGLEIIDDFFKKYLKYKTKYIKLKNHF
jgi:hypothetical protein